MAIPSITDLNLSSLATATTAVTALSNLVLAVPNIYSSAKTQGYQPGLPPGSPLLQLPPALLFHYEGEQTVTVEADITDHYVEDNTAIQDQIALRPEIITTHGFIGELNDVAPPLLSTIQSIATALTPIAGYVPALSLTALIAYTEAFQLYQVGKNAINAAVSAYSSFLPNAPSGEAIVGTGGNKNISNTNLASQSKQQIMFQQLYGYMQQRTLFTVQTPWAVFLNCAIKTLRAVQDEETRMITDFEVQFKVIKTASTQTKSTPIGSGRWDIAGQATTQLGNSNLGNPVSQIKVLAPYPNVLPP